MFNFCWCFLLGNLSFINLSTRIEQEFYRFESVSVTIIGDFWQPFCVGKTMAARRQRRGKRQLLEENDIFSTQLGW